LPDKYLGRREQMFPRLSTAQLGRLEPAGRRRRVRAGEIVAEQGDATPSFFVVLSGALYVGESAFDPRTFPREELVSALGVHPVRAYATSHTRDLRQACRVPLASRARKRSGLRAGQTA